MWVPEMATGHPKIDSQHRTLVVLINKFLDVIDAPSDHYQSDIRNAIAAIAVYTDLHFRMEEGLMFLSCYPGAIQHIEGHDQIRMQIDILLERFSEGPVSRDELRAMAWSWAPEAPVSGDDLELAKWLISNQDPSCFQA